MKRKVISQVLCTIVVVCGLAMTMASLASCDTPQSIAWSYYNCARDTLAAGDPLAAKHFLNKCQKDTDPSLRTKADSLMRVIDHAIGAGKTLGN